MEQLNTSISPKAVRIQQLKNQIAQLESETVSGNPDILLDVLKQKLNLKNDAALCRALEVLPPVISKIRHRRLPVGASLLIRMHEESGLSIRELKSLAGLKALAGI